jgi:hypothetical protein
VGAQAAVCVLLVFLVLAVGQIVLIIQDHARIAAAPRLTAEALDRAYQKQSGAAKRQYDHKFLIVTGYVSGVDEGLLGDGAIHLADSGGDIECDVDDHYGDCVVNQPCTVAGVCDGIDSYYVIHFSDCRVLSAQRSAE